MKNTIRQFVILLLAMTLILSLSGCSNLFGLEGKRRLVKACRICLSYKGGQYEYDYLISDMKDAFTNIKQTTGVTLHGILGSKFFNTYKYVLDFDKMIAYSKL